MAKDTNLNACLMHHKHALYAYVFSFSEAANILIDKATTDDSHIDILIYAILFNTHHYLELQMKWILEAELGNYDQSHKLLVLWEHAKKVLLKWYPNGTQDELGIIETLVTEISDNTLHHTDFRYDKRHDGKSSFPDRAHINLSALKKSLHTVSELFDGIMEEYFQRTPHPA